MSRYFNDSWWCSLYNKLVIWLNTSTLSKYVKLSVTGRRCIPPQWMGSLCPELQHNQGIVLGWDLASQFHGCYNRPKKILMIIVSHLLHTCCQSSNQCWAEDRDWWSSLLLITFLTKVMLIKWNQTCFIPGTLRPQDHEIPITLAVH